MLGTRFLLLATALVLAAGSGCCHHFCEKYCNRPAAVAPVAVAPAAAYAAPACVPCQPICCPQPCCPVGSSPAPTAGPPAPPGGWQRGPYQ